MKKIIGIFVLIIVLTFIVFLNGSIMHNKKNDIFNSEIILSDITTPILINPTYSKNHYIVADYILSASNSDMTNTIQKSLNACKQNKGGTVWLEKGIYNVSSPITIPSGCTLMGDWQDPDNYNGPLDYGTKIVVDVNKFSKDNSNDELSGLFKIEASAGVEGLTIYYKNQDINNPKSQPWSFYYKVEGDAKKYTYMLYTIKNITMINSYRGIGRGLSEGYTHEMLMIENVKGTTIHTGVVIHNSGEVGTIDGLSLKSDYWSNVNVDAFNDNSTKPTYLKISNKIKSLGGKGLVITDVESQEYFNIDLSGFKYGIYIPNANDIKPRYMGMGSFYNLSITNCEIGFMVEEGKYYKESIRLYYSMIDKNSGYLISNSYIEGSKYARYNGSPLIKDSEKDKIGTIKLNDVKVKGIIHTTGESAKGRTTSALTNVIYNNGTGTYINAVNVGNEKDVTGTINNTNRFSNSTLEHKLKNNGKNLEVLSSNNSINEINNKLVKVSNAGGGVVYLKPGVYNINKQGNDVCAIKVPANVELRGSSAVSSRFFDIGTTFNVKDDVRAVCIHGSNSGVSGINFVYSDVARELYNSSSYFPKNYDYSIFVEGSNNLSNIYIKNVSIAGGSYGVYLNKCNDYSIENLVTGVVKNAIRIDNSNKGLIKNSLQNGTVIIRNRLVHYDEEAGRDGRNQHVTDVSAENLNYIVLNNTHKIEIQNCFTWASSVFLTANNSTIYAVNIGYDGMSESNGIVFKNNNSKATVVNTLRAAGVPLSSNDKSFGLYNIVRTLDVGENDIVASNYLPTSQTLLSGDISDNGKIDTMDYILLRKYLLKSITLNGNQLFRADVNLDGGISSLDYILIRKTLIYGSGTNPTPTPVPTEVPIPTSSPAINIPPTIYDWTSTSLFNTTIGNTSATTTICNLGTDSDDGLKIIEYYTNCTKRKTTNISNGCATITISACPNSVLNYRLKDTNNYSQEISVNDIGKYLIYAQVYNKLLYPGIPAQNSLDNLGYHVARSNQKISSRIKEIGNIAVTQHANDSNQTFLSNLYNGIISRNVDDSGVDYWLGRLNNGISRNSVLEELINSGEAKAIYSAWGYN